MKIPQTFGFLINYSAHDKLDSLCRSLNHQSSSKLVSVWNRLVQWIPYVGKKLMVSIHASCKCDKKMTEQFSIRKTEVSDPYVNKKLTNMDQNMDYFLLSVLHSQQTSFNGCSDACLDMLGQYFDCTSLKSSVTKNPDGLRLMPVIDRPLLEGMTNRDFHDKLEEAGLKRVTVEPESDKIKNALKLGPVLASINFAFGFMAHAVIVIGYHGDQFIINDPWHGGHLLKSTTWLINNLYHKSSTPPLESITRK